MSENLLLSIRFSTEKALRECRLFPEKPRKELLETTNLKIYEISTNVGFQSVEHFSRSFKKIAGKSPKEFRQVTTDK